MRTARRPARVLVLQARLSHKAPPRSLDPFYAGVAKGIALVTPAPAVAMSARSTALVPHSASVQRRFRIGFARQPRVIAITRNVPAWVGSASGPSGLRLTASAPVSADQA
jgi:hypothetical protein